MLVHAAVGWARREFSQMLDMSATQSFWDQIRKVAISQLIPVIAEEGESEWVDVPDESVGANDDDALVGCIKDLLVHLAGGKMLLEVGFKAVPLSLQLSDLFGKLSADRDRHQFGAAE